MGGISYRATFFFFVWVSSLTASALELANIYVAAKARPLPVKFFEEIETAIGLSGITIVSGSGAFYDDRRSAIVLPKTYFHSGPFSWSAVQWSNFYNELFHAWWLNVFSRSVDYRSQFESLTERHRSKYSRANLVFPTLAQEEAYSETVSTLALLMANKTQDEKLKYHQNFTVMAVSHSDRPGYSPEAENIYPDEAEYEALFKWMTGRTLRR